MTNNPLYENIHINHCLLKIWKNKVILSGIMDNIIQFNADRNESKVYATNFKDYHFENDFNVVIAGTGMKGNHINSDYVYSDIDH